MIPVRTLLTVIVLSVCTLSSRAEAGKGCYAAQGRDSRRIKSYVVSTRAYPNQEEFIDECMVVVKDEKGKTVFAAHDHGVEILSISGEDINGDGQPDVVIEGYSGGAHCCWTYWIVSLGVCPRLLASIYNERDVTFRKERSGQVLIETLDGRFDYFDGSCHACSTFPRVYMRLKRDQLEEVNSEFWPSYQKDIHIARLELKTEELSKFRARDKPDAETDDTRKLVLTIVLAYIYAGRQDQAWQTLDEMWPAQDKERIKALIIEQRGRGFVGRHDD
jgi:hypothetical protein